MTLNKDKLQNQKNFYDLDDNAINEILAKLPAPKYYEFLYSKDNYFKTVTEPIIIESYNSIKAETWPDCFTLDDISKLPSNILEECNNIHKFNPMIWTKNKIDNDTWHNYQGGSYPIQDLIRFKYNIFDNLDCIKDKKIVDLAGHTGLFSLLSLYSGAKHAITTNVRQQFLDIASDCMELAGYKDQYQSLFADLHDYQLTTDICKNADTVFLFGTIYHLYDHMLVLESIAKANPSTIIIDQPEDPNIMDLNIPMISWNVEPTDSWTDGWAKGKDKVFSGLPNKVWLDTAMDLLNYKSSNSKRYKQFRDNATDKLFYRSTNVYVNK